MSAEMIILVLLIATALAFDFTNGFHDTGNAMATSIATGALKPKTAVLLAGVLNLVGAFLSVEVAVTVTTSVLKVQDSKSGHLLPGIDPSMGLTIIFAGLIGGILWNLLTWLFGIPSSSSHALFGGLIGAGLAALGSAGVNWSGIFQKVLIPAFASPVIACLVAVVAGSVMLISPSLFRSHTSTPGQGASASASTSGSTSASSAHSAGAAPSGSVPQTASPSPSAATKGSTGLTDLPSSSPSASSASGSPSATRPSASATTEPGTYPIAGVSMSNDSAAVQDSGASAGPAGGCTAWLDDAGSGKLYGMLNTSYFETCHAELIRNDGLTVDLAASTGAERTGAVSDIGHSTRICVWQQGASADKQCSAPVVIHNGAPAVQ